jgi:hypothetical protein
LVLFHFKLFIFRVRLHITRIHKETGRAVRERLADALRKALPQSAGAALGEQRQARDDPAGHRRGGVFGPRVHQGRAVHRSADEKRHQDRTHKHGNITPFTYSKIVAEVQK